MSIPKRLILYRASRYHYPLPYNIKYGYCSKKVTSTSSSREGQPSSQVYFTRCRKKKFVTEIEFEFKKVEEDSHEELEFSRTTALKIFSAFRNAKKCTIHFLYSEEKRNVWKLFKTLKKIKNLVIYLMDEVLWSSSFFASLLLAKSLESLTLFKFDYSINTTGLQLFMGTIKKAAKRRSWTNFKSLNIDLTSENYSGVSKPEGIRNVLRFMQNLKAEEKFYKCSSFKFELPLLPKFDPEQTGILEEIIKITPSLSKLKISRFSCSNDVLNILKSWKPFKRVSMKVTTEPFYKIEQRPDLSSLNEIATFQELEIPINPTSDPLYKDFLVQTQTLVNLLHLSIVLVDTRNLKEEVQFSISNLSQLKSLKMSFIYSDESETSRASNHVWLKNMFQEIGKKEKLERFSLSFCCFYCDDFGDLLLILGRSLKELPHLSNLYLCIGYPGYNQAKEITAFCRCLSGVNKLQDFWLRLDEEKGYRLKEEDFNLLLECIATSFPLLSNLALEFYGFKISPKSRLLNRLVLHRMKALNSLKLWLAKSRLQWKIFQQMIRRKVHVELR